MTEERFLTLFIPSIPGQYKLWKKELAPWANRVHNVIQMGNLVSVDGIIKDSEKVGANAAILKYAALYKRTAEKFTQLIGPNEIFALNMPDEFTNYDSLKILTGGWLSEDPYFYVACAMNNKLVTHGGLTYGEWVAIGRPETAEDAADLLNEKYLGTLYQGPCYRLGNAPNYAANPIFADPVMELYPSWITTLEPCPFDQIHGSGSLDGIVGREAITERLNPMYFIERVTHRKYGSYVFNKDAEILGLDLKLPDGKQNTVIPKLSSLYIEASE